MKILKYFIVGFISAVTAVILTNLIQEKTQSSRTREPVAQQSREIPSPTPENPLDNLVFSTPSPAPTPTPDPIIQALNSQSNSDNIDTIRRDFDQTDFSVLDRGIVEIESDYNELRSSGTTVPDRPATEPLP